MKSTLSTIYMDHHKARRKPGFTVLEAQRSSLLLKWIGNDKNILDIGCRDGALTRYFSKDNRVTGADIDTHALEKLSRYNIEALYMDLNGDWAELKGKKYDVIVAAEVLEHLYFPPQVIQKVIAHLAPGGIFVGSIPNAFTLKHRLRYLRAQKAFTPLQDPTHITQFSYKEFKELLESFFHTVQIVGVGRHEKLAEWFPNLCGFDLVFQAFQAR